MPNQSFELELNAFLMYGTGLYLSPGRVRGRGFLWGGSLDFLDNRRRDQL